MKKNKNVKNGVILLIFFAVVFATGFASVDKSKASSSQWVVVDTGQGTCYNNTRQISCPGVVRTLRLPNATAR